MFVPLPVPFVFQRATPDLSAWRLKSPLALRSNSGKTVLFIFLFTLIYIFLLLFISFFLSSVCYTHPPCRPALQTRPDALAELVELSARAHPLYTRTSPGLLFL